MIGQIWKIWSEMSLERNKVLVWQSHESAKSRVSGLTHCDFITNL